MREQNYAHSRIMDALPHDAINASIIDCSDAVIAQAIDLLGDLLKVSSKNLKRSACINQIAQIILGTRARLTLLSWSDQSHCRSCVSSGMRRWRGLLRLPWFLGIANTIYIFNAQGLKRTKSLKICEIAPVGRIVGLHLIGEIGNLDPQAANHIILNIAAHIYH